MVLLVNQKAAESCPECHTCMCICECMCMFVCGLVLLLQNLYAQVHLHRCNLKINVASWKRKLVLTLAILHHFYNILNSS